MKIRLQKRASFYFAVLAFLMVNLGWGQVDIIPIRTDVSGFSSWTDTNVAGTTYIQLLVANANTVTPAMNFSSYSNTTLKFKARTYGGTTTAEIQITVSVSVDNGSNWSTLGVYTPTTSSLLEQGPINLSSYTGSQVKIRFSVAGTNNSIGVGIDDIQISGVLSTNDTTSKVESPATQVSTVDLASTATASGSAVDVFKFKVSDLGSGDGLATKVTQVKIKKASGTADWTDHIGGVSLWDGANPITIGTPTITDADITIPITSGNLDISDNSSKEITLKMWLKTSNIVDNATMAFTVSPTGHGFTSDASGSSFATDFGAAVTSNTVTVRATATQLVFTTQPSSTVCPSTNLATAPVVKAVDANGTVDLDYTSQITLTNSGALGMTGNQVSAVQGVASFTNLQFTQSGAVTLNATAVGLPDSSASNSVTISLANVTSAASSNGDTTSLLTWSNPSCFDEIMIVAKAGSAASIVPSGDGTLYSASLTFGLGSAYDGGFVVYKGGTSSQTVTGLTNGTTYYFTFFTRKGSVWSTGVSTTATPNFMSQASDYFRTKASGNWNSVSTWESSSNGSSNWISATLTPTSTANAIAILSGHNVTVTATVSVDQVTVNTNGKIIVNSGQTLTIADGADTFDLSVNGIIENSGTITTTGAVKFESGGYYKHTANGGSMVKASWDANSTCEISGITSATALTNLGSGQTTAYGNLIWNCTGQTAWFNATGSFDVAGNFTVNSTGGGARGINLVTSSVNRTFNIGGNLEVNGAKLTLTNSSGIATLNIGGNLVLNNSSLNQLDFGFGTSVPSSGNYRSVINLSGDFYNGVSSNILITTTASYYGKIAFVKNGEQIFNNSSLSDMNGIDYVVSSGSTLKLNADMFLGQYDSTDVLGTLDCGSSNKIIGSGDLTISNGGTLKTSNLNATDAYAAAVGITGTATLASGSTVELNGTAPQFLGARTFSNLKINNAAGVVAKGDLTVNGTLDLSANPNATNGALEMVIDYTGYAQNPYGTGDYTNSTASFNNLSSYVLTMGSSATMVGIGDVTGKIRRTSLVDNITYTFGNKNTQLRLNSVSGSAIPSQITVVATRGTYGTHIDNTGGVAINGTTANRNAVQRLYQILRTGGDAASRFTLRMAYEDGDLNGNTEANLVSWDHHLPYGAITPHEHGKTSANATENWVELSNHSVNYLATEGATTFTKYWMLSAKESLNDYEWLGAVAVPGQTNWNITENWKSGKIPNEGANVFIPNAALTANDPVINSDSGYGILDGTTVTTGQVRMRTLEIASGGVLTVASGAAPTITLYGGPNVGGGGGVNYGSWLNNGTFTAANSTVIFDFDNTATESTIAGSTTFNNLTIANGKRATIQENAQIAISGTLTNGGVLDATTNLNTVIFNGSTDQTVVATNGSNLAYYSLELGGTGVKSFATAPSIKGDFIQSGSATITVPSVITFNGLTAQNIVGLNYNNIVFSEAGTKTFTSNGSLSNTGAVTFSGTPGVVDFDGASDNLTFVLKSDASGTARIENSTGWTLNGKVTAERYIPSRRAWRLLTAPLKGVTNTTIPANWQGVNNEGLLLFSPSTYQSQTMTGYTTGGGSPNIWKYDSANTQWQSIPNLATENLFTSTGNNGFLVFATGPSNSTNIATGAATTTLKPQGHLITGAVSHSLTADKYHLIGNPYASAIDTEAMVQANSGTKVFMVDPTMGTVGGYVTYDGSNWAPTAPNTSDKYIQSGQGFFVRSASNTTFTISESHKAIGNSNTWFERANSSSNSSSSSSDEADKIRVLLYKQLNSQWQLADGILAVNSVGGNDGVDAVDTGKMTNFNENIAFRNGTSNLAIEYRGLPTTGTVQQMRLTGTTVQPYQLRVKTENYSNSGLQPYLEDTQAGTFTLIPTDGSDVVVNFTGMAATSAAPDARFRIVYPSALGVDAPDALAVGVYPNPTEEGVFTILLPLAGETARYTLTNLVGQEVQQGTLDSVSSRVSVSSLQGGVYLLEVNQSGKRFTTKLIIK